MRRLFDNNKIYIIVLNFVFTIFFKTIKLHFICSELVTGIQRFSIKIQERTLRPMNW